MFDKNIKFYSATASFVLFAVSHAHFTLKKTHAQLKGHWNENNVKIKLSYDMATTQINDEKEYQVP